MEEEKTKTPEDADGSEREAPAGAKYVAPGVPVVRTSTPRPGPFVIPAKTELPLAPSAPASDFPAQPPEAPPLPEESERLERARSEGAVPPTPGPVAAGASRVPASTESEFIWLFEYALDMDPVQLNRPERLNGAAFAYGPALLKGYRLVFDGLDARGHVVASLDKAPEEMAEAEIWGVLYRVPRRFTRAEAGEVALLDKVHGAGSFAPLEVRVREPYRQREISCLTYVASQETRRRVERLPLGARSPQPAYLKRLLQVARHQKLPASYLDTLERLLPENISGTMPITTPEHDTEPLPAVLSGKKPSRLEPPDFPGEEAEARPVPWRAPYPVRTERRLMAFALYLAGLVLCTLVLAVFQGLAFWPEVFNNAFTPLGVPWYVLLYGLLGGCISCVISLNRLPPGDAPGFVVLTWFLRPFLGAILGSFAYLLLNSGAILLSSQPAQHFALCAIVGALAGLCEGKVLPGGKGWRTSA
jgi:hypothetical protein